MRNLHNYYYKEYFSDLDFSVLVKKEELEKSKNERKELEKVNDTITKNLLLPNKKKEIKDLEDTIKNLETDNKNKLSDDKNKALTAGDYTSLILEKSNPSFLFLQDDTNKDEGVIKLKVQYPGLVTGVGIDHEAKIEGEFKLGVHFDWTYGMPIVYASSVKGVLRAWFCEFYEGELDPCDLMMDIFSGVYNRDIKAEKEAYGEKWEKMVKDPKNRIYKSRRSIYERDIFFDAVLTAPDKKGRILCSDSITPHEDNPLKNPTPLTFMKIAPGCKLEFRFKLVPTEIVKDGKTLKISAQEKLDIFKEILTTVGIGAKTNVGYGQLK